MIEVGSCVVLVKNGIKGVVTGIERTKSMDLFTSHEDVCCYMVAAEDGKEIVCLEKDLQIDAPEDHG